MKTLFLSGAICSICLSFLSTNFAEEISPGEASRFLMQTTFGPTDDEIARVQKIGYANWIDDQLSKPPETILPVIADIHHDALAIFKGLGHNGDIEKDVMAHFRETFYVADNVGEEILNRADRPVLEPDDQAFVGREAKKAGLSEGAMRTWRVKSLAYDEADEPELEFIWWTQAINGNDQLRKRVAFAWSQHFVVSFYDGNIHLLGIEAQADYYDTLAVNGLGNFRDLLKYVTFHPCMGTYLTYINSQKTNQADTIHPDENYAREIMQLFTIGLWELNPDGTKRLKDGNPIPAYTNDDVRELARVFTGIGYTGGFNSRSALIDSHGACPTGSPAKAGKYPFGQGWSDKAAAGKGPNVLDYYPSYHDDGVKVLVGGRKTLPAGQGPAKDIDDALDCLFEHPNTPPFISRSLIERFTTSNPSPAYVKRIADVFINNGKGVRGDLTAVIRAILLDPEARHPSERLDTGKLREPLLRFSALIRAFKPTGQYGIFKMYNSRKLMEEEPLCSTTVFNFYHPDYGPPGPIVDAGMVAPEFQITDAITSIGLPNYFRDCIYKGTVVSRGLGSTVKLDFSSELPLAGNVDALIDRYNILLTGDTMGAETHDIIHTAVSQIPASQPADRVKLAAYLTSISPDSAIQP